MFNIIRFDRRPSGQRMKKRLTAGAIRQENVATHIESLESRQLLSAGLVINATYDSSITSKPDASAIEAAINTAIHNFESDIATPITVNVKFKAITSGLADSDTYHIEESYSAYVKALAAHATSAADAAAVKSLPTTTNNPVNGGADILLSDANARALGFSVSPPGGLDSTIGFNLSLFNLTRFNINYSHYDLIASASHELDEVLGIDSGLNANNAGQPIPASFVAAEDLFRYSLNGKRSYTTSSSVESAFSYDGGHTFVARFNQTKGDDYNDWYSPGGQAPQVQDANGTPGATPNLGTELTVLDVLGYKLAPGVIGGFKPDLTPGALAGWSSPLVVTTVKGSLVDSPTLPTGTTLYLDAAVQNNGETATTTSEINTIVLDGKTIYTFNDGPGLKVGDAYYSIGLSLGTLSAGTHTITINADVKNTVSEIIESNNSYTRTFTVTAPLPDLQPYAPNGWSSPLVYTTSSTSFTTSTSIAANSTLYVDAAYGNFGPVATPAGVKFLTYIELDGKIVATLQDTSPPLNAGFFYYFPHINIGKVAAGKHTLEMTIDPTNLVAESDKANNILSETFTVG